MASEPPPSKAARALEQRIRDPRSVYIGDVARAVEDLPPAAFREVIAGSEDPEMRRIACGLVGRLAIHGLTDVLIAALQSSDSELQQAAAESLWKVPDPAAGPALPDGLEALRSDRDLWSWHNFVIALGAARYGPARKTLEQCAGMAAADPMLAKLARLALAEIDKG